MHYTALQCCHGLDWILTSLTPSSYRIAFANPSYCTRQDVALRVAVESAAAAVEANVNDVVAQQVLIREKMKLKQEKRRLRAERRAQRDGETRQRQEEEGADASDPAEAT